MDAGADRTGEDDDIVAEAHDIVAEAHVTISPSMSWLWRVQT